MTVRTAGHRAGQRRPAPYPPHRPEHVAIPYARIVAGSVVVGTVLVLGGYVFGWRWTGLSSSVTLWDWLQVLALPVAVGAAPILLLRRRRLTRPHRMALAVALAVFAGFVLAAYLVPMGWTGFSGNTLWDWLELALLPLVIASASLWISGAGVHRRHLRVAVPAVLAFVALALAGYLVPMGWTGFRGNTAWDWVKLLLVPILVPTVFLPLVNQWLVDRLGEGDDDDPPP
jgi:uncharacterized membrane protein YhdT